MRKLWFGLVALVCLSATMISTPALAAQPSTAVQTVDGLYRRLDAQIPAWQSISGKHSARIVAECGKTLQTVPARVRNQLLTYYQLVYAQPAAQVYHTRYKSAGQRLNSARDHLRELRNLFWANAQVTASYQPVDFCRELRHWRHDRYRPTSPAFRELRKTQRIAKRTYRTINFRHVRQATSSLTAAGLRADFGRRLSRNPTFEQTVAQDFLNDPLWAIIQDK